MYVGLKQEFELLGKCFATYLPAAYPYDVVGGSRFIKIQDFNENIDILPVADPNIFSQTQRITLAQTELQFPSHDRCSSNAGSFGPCGAGLGKIRSIFFTPNASYI